MLVIQLHSSDAILWYHICNIFTVVSDKLLTKGDLFIRITFELAADRIFSIMEAQWVE